MTDKTRWLGLGPWHEDNESELIDWTAQPQYKGLVKGDYYHAELRYSGRWGDPGHKGELDVVFDDDGKIAFAEFNETTMGNYYVRHFQNVSKRRTEFQFFQDFHDKRRSVAYGRVLANGFKYVEDQILEKQDLDADYDLLTGASFSMKNMIGLKNDCVRSAEGLQPQEAAVLRLHRGLRLRYHRLAPGGGGGRQDRQVLLR